MPAANSAVTSGGCSTYALDQAAGGRTPSRKGVGLREEATLRCRSWTERKAGMRTSRCHRETHPSVRSPRVVEGGRDPDSHTCAATNRGPGCNCRLGTPSRSTMLIFEVINGEARRMSMRQEASMFRFNKGGSCDAYFSPAIERPGFLAGESIRKPREAETQRRACSCPGKEARSLIKIAERCATRGPIRVVAVFAAN